jgi:hypothetical protein
MTETVKVGEKAGGKEKKSVVCSHCSKSGYNNENYFVVHPKKRPTSSSASSEAMKNLLAKIAELKKQMSTMASLGQKVDTRALMRRQNSSSWMDAYLYGASKDVVAAIATRAQTTAKAVAPSSPTMVNGGYLCHSGLPNQI